MLAHVSCHTGHTRPWVRSLHAQDTLISVFLTFEIAVIHSLDGRIN
jgi:hypothetical protein